MRRLCAGTSCVVTFAIVAACSGDPDASPPAIADDGGGASEASTPPGSDAAEPGLEDAEADAASEDAGADASTCTPPATPPRIVFLNRAGGTYTPGFDDARTNKVPHVASTTVVSAWSVSDVSWQSLVGCVKKKLSPFNVTVTDVDPGDQEHFEVVFAQGALPLFAGSPAIVTFNCSVVPNAIVFVSQAYAEASLANGCAVAVRHLGHAFGLDAVTACPDAMTFDPTACADAAFTDVPLQCGLTTPADCQCASGTTQSSYTRLLAVMGPRCL